MTLLFRQILENSALCSLVGKLQRVYKLLLYLVFRDVGRLARAYPFPLRSLKLFMALLDLRSMKNPPTLASHPRAAVHPHFVPRPAGVPVCLFARGTAGGSSSIKQSGNGERDPRLHFPKAPPFDPTGAPRNIYSSRILLAEDRRGTLTNNPGLERWIILQRGESLVLSSTDQ